MSYSKEELLSLPVKEKQELAEALWNSIDDDLMPISNEEIMLAEKRYQEHLKNPSEGFTWEEFREKIKTKYGF